MGKKKLTLETFQKGRASTKRPPVKVTDKVTENSTELITDKVTDIVTESNTETITENVTGNVTDKVTELKKNINSKRPTGKTKQTISIDKKKYDKLKKYCKKNNISFQSLMTQLIDLFYKEL